MPDKDKQFDPANPENKAITDGMERDGETLRDIREGKSPTELAFGIDLGIKAAQELADEHDALQSELEEVIAEEEGRTSPVPPDLSPIEIEQANLSPGSKPGPVAQAAAIPVTPLESLRRRQRMQSEHGRALVELNRVIEQNRPQADVVAPGALPPDVAARIAHPGKEKQNELAQAVAEFAQEEKLWRAAVRDMFKTMAEDIVQHRLELERMRGELERGRL